MRYSKFSSPRAAAAEAITALFLWSSLWSRRRRVKYASIAACPWGDARLYFALDPRMMRDYLMSTKTSDRLSDRPEFNLTSDRKTGVSPHSPELSGITLQESKLRHQDFGNSRRREFDADAFSTRPRAFGTRPRFSQPRFEAPSGPPVSGVVKWFNSEKGFGFIELSDGSGDAFLHGSVLAQTGTATVQT